MHSASRTLCTFAVLSFFLFSACGSADEGGDVIDRPKLPVTLKLEPIHDGYLMFHTVSNIFVDEDGPELLVAQYDDVGKKRSYLQFDFEDEDGNSIDIATIQSVELVLKENIPSESNPRTLRLYLMEEDYLMDGFTEEDFDIPLGAALGAVEEGMLKIHESDFSLLNSPTLSFVLKVDNEDDFTYDSPYSFQSMENGVDGPRLIVKFKPKA